MAQIVKIKVSGRPRPKPYGSFVKGLANRGNWSRNPAVRHYREWADNAQSQLANWLLVFTKYLPSLPYRLSIDIYAPGESGDYDNYYKGIVDQMKHAGFFPDDTVKYIKGVGAGTYHNLCDMCISKGTIRCPGKVARKKGGVKVGGKIIGGTSHAACHLGEIIILIEHCDEENP